MNAILFVLRTGCQWGALDATGICSCSSTYRRFREWEEAGVFLEFWRRGLLAYDKSKGIESEWLAADGQLAKSPLGGERSGPNPTDRAKRGVKRSLLCDGAGVPIGLEVAGANIRDEKLLRATLESIPIARPDAAGLELAVCLDKGYDYSEVYELLDEFGFTAHVRSRRQEADAIKHEAGFRARRWVVERTHSWLNRFRRLVRWEKRARTYIAMLHLACGLITWREALKPTPTEIGSMPNCGRTAGNHSSRISLEIRYDRVYEPYAVGCCEICLAARVQV
jgi:putative transposase